jgi:putative phosphoribosyl transferase
MTKPTMARGSTGLAIEHLAVTIPVDSVHLEGDLSVPTAASGVVLFAHGSGSSRRSPRNRYVADLLNESGLATLLMDLLTEDEQEVDLAKRLIAITQWLTGHPEVARLKIGHFVAAAQLPHLVRAVVSRGGRPDLAGPALAHVEAPTLLIVGGTDPVILDLNQKALGLMHCEKALKVVPGASHLFEEPGTLQIVAELARDWFVQKLAAPQRD